MNVKKLIFWGVLFCTLLVYVIVVEQNEPKQEGGSQEKLVKVFSFSPDNLQRIEISRGDTRLTIIRTDRVWKLLVPFVMSLNQETVESLISAVVDLVQIEVVTNDAVDVTQYGLDQPHTILSLFFKEDNTPVTLLLGKDSPAGLSMYAMIRGSNEVIQIGTLLRFSINTFMELCFKNSN